MIVVKYITKDLEKKSFQKKSQTKWITEEYDFFSSPVVILRVLVDLWSINFPKKPKKQSTCRLSKGCGWSASSVWVKMSLHTLL